MGTTRKVALFGAGLAGAFVLAMGIGYAVGPIGEPADAHAQGEEHGTDHVDETDAMAGMEHGSEAVPGGVLTSEDGFTLALGSTERAVGHRVIAFQILDDAGRPVTDYDVEHEKQMHLIVVRRDFTGFQHVHPEIDADGVWRATADLTPGAWRVFADFTSGGHDLTLGADLSVPGTISEAPRTPVTTTDLVDGYDVTVTGDLEAGVHSMLTFDISRDGEPVTDLEPYLGAYGHLVALREGDLAYLHVHPADGPAGPDVEFGAEVPTAGRYHLYLNFQHDGVVHTAELTMEAGHDHD